MEFKEWHTFIVLPSQQREVGRMSRNNANNNGKKSQPGNNQDSEVAGSNGKTKK